MSAMYYNSLSATIGHAMSTNSASASIVGHAMSNSAPASIVGAQAMSNNSASAIVGRAMSGSHTLRIEGYSTTKGLGIGNCITSRCFTVGGHRWRLQYYPDGREHSSPWISIFLSLDPTETNAVRAKYKISLLDQNGHPVAAYVKDSKKWCTFSRNDDISYWQMGNQFIKREDLEGSAHLKDDAFSVRYDITVVTEIITEDVSTPPLAVASEVTGRPVGLTWETFHAGRPR